jgi:DNA-binding MarR family transcriptional regulator
MTTTPPPSRAANRHFDSLQQEVYLNLWRTYDRLRVIEDELFREYDLSPQQYNALRLLRAVHPQPLPTLAISKRLVSHAPDITRLLDKLEQRGLISRERPPENRRSVLATISRAGLDLLGELDEQVRESHLRQLGHLSEADLKRLAELLRAARAPHELEGGPWTL